MKTIKNILLFFVICLIIFGLCLFFYQCGRYKSDVLLCPVEIKVPMSVGETQQILKDLGYYQGKVDYIWKDETERAYNQYLAERNFKN